MHSSATADLRETNLEASGHVLEPVMLDEAEAQVFQAPRCHVFLDSFLRFLKENPYLQGCGCLRIPKGAADAAESLCKEQLALCLRSAEGDVLDCTGVSSL